MPTPFTELTISNITPGSSAYLAYDVTYGFRLFQTVVDGSVDYLRDITSVTPPDATRTLADNATVRGNTVSVPGTTVAVSSVTTGRRYKILTLGDTAATYASIGAITTSASNGFEIGRQYIILTVGTTDYTLIGASANTVGVIFTALGAGSGTGTAYEQYFTATGAGSGTGTVVSDFSEVGSQVGQPIKINGIWCNINSYVSERAITVDRVVSEVNTTTGNFVVGQRYRIVTVGDTSFTAIGASGNTIGVEFVATGVGGGTTGVAAAIGIVYPSYYPNVVEDTIIGLISVISANATAIVTGATYQILTTGTTDYTAFGASANTIGVEFTAAAPAAVTAGAFVSGKRYTIASVGSTDFMAIGASANTIGVAFTATGAGTGTGTATPTLGTGTVTYYTIERYFTAYNTIPTGSLLVAGTFPGESRIDSGSGDLYIWSGTTWVASGGSASEVIVSATAPGAPTTGMQWFRTTDSRMFMWNGTAWVQTIPGVSGTRLIDTTAEDGLYEGETVIDSTDGNMYIWDTGAWVLVLESVAFDLSNQVHGCPSDFAGTTVDYTGANTQLSVFSGATDVTSLWTITKSEGAGITGTLTNPGPHKLYTVTSITSDVATVEFTASRTGYADRIATFTVIRVRAGEGGVGTVYQVIPSVGAVKYNLTTYTPATITYESFFTTGADVPSAYAGRFKIYYSTNGIDYTLDYTSSGNESSKVYTPSVANIKFIKAELYLAGGVTTLLDYENIPVIIDGAQGTGGPQGTLGVQGVLGPNGPSGPQGVLGPTGGAGPQGTNGPIGVQGVLGPTGGPGAQGLTGPIGTQGVLGPTGGQGPQGLTGPLGVQGGLGPTGAGGPQGLTGPLGVQGGLGPTGGAGPQGLGGPIGTQGSLGPTGGAGPQGTGGPTGTQGALGTTGPAGSQGTRGPTGTQGNLGTAGVQGGPGNTGPIGVQGTLGPTGPTGPVGNTGPIGTQGGAGPTGGTGTQGLSGPSGVQGGLGPTGGAGPQGSSGPSGVQGSLGPAGSQGVTGNAGPTGVQGLLGPNGPAGSQGSAGPSGPGGAVGPAGTTGPTGATLYVYYASSAITTLDVFPTPADWVSAGTYTFNQVVYYSNKIYALKTVAGITGVATNPTTDTTNWLQVYANGAAIGTTITAGSFVVGKSYRIKTSGTTNFTLIGSSSSAVGTYFTATGVGTGTGTAEELVHTKLTPTQYVAGESRFRCVDNSHYWYANATQVSGGVTSVKWTIFATETNSANIGTEDFGNPILSIGQTGPTGATGGQGSQGALGPSGAQGGAGPTGGVGPTGANGPQGVGGPAGPTGAPGTTGANGPQGVGGPAGPTGAAGTPGANGPQGVGGPAGPTGAAGTPGANGPQGVGGPAGPTGAPGATGANGPQGVGGPAGSPGAAGTPGANGPQGVGGPVGSPGGTGATGATGPAGPAGSAGNAVAFDVTGAYNNASGASSRSDYIRTYRGSNLVKQGDVYWNVTNGEVWQWQSADDTTGNDLTLTKLVDWIDADSVKVSSLSALTATIGLLRTASSGARTEIEDNVIRVYDSSNVLRVRMGIW